ncbi:thiolase family protein, partial [Cesiribacter andamanensis]
METAYIVDILRTPVGKFGGTLASVRPDDLAALVIRQLLERNPQLPPQVLEEVVFGAANQAGEDNRNVARMAALMAGLPVEVCGVTVNRLCASGLQSIIDASRALKGGDGAAYIAGGVESMTRAPFVMAKSETAWGRTPEIYDTTIGWRFTNPKLAEAYHPFSMGETAENVAERWGVSRQDQDEFAYHSQRKWKEAQEQGKFTDELVAVPVP